MSAQVFVSEVEPVLVPEVVGVPEVVLGPEVVPVVELVVVLLCGAADVVVLVSVEVDPAAPPNSEEDRPVGDKPLVLLSCSLNEECAVLTIWPSCTLADWAIWPQPWPC